ncbi:MAG: sodium-dependent transporter [Phycisphaerales bacterium]|nr:sodium-dependent transporter [Phycisphaerales bacterium]
MSERAQWGSRTGFILAAAGSAVGLGNIWKFPYITGTNGGGWFVLIYLACILLVGLPILAAEIMIGRAAQAQPVVAFERLKGKPTGWSLIGWMGVIGAFLILSFYIVVAGWSMDYTVKHLVDFGKPIREQAVAESRVYEATTSTEAMRDSLIAARADRIADPRIDAIEARVAPSVWKLNAEFESAMAATTDSDVPDLVRRARLLGDPRVQAAVAKVDSLSAEMKDVRDDADRTAKEEFDDLDEASIRRQGADQFRRGLIGDRMGALFGGLATDGWTSIFWAGIFMFLTIAVVATGIGKGIEAACKVLMPILIVMILGMVAFATTLPGFAEGMSFVFKPDASALKPSGVLEALGHAFFTLSLGMGALITYGSYQKRGTPLFGQAVWIAGLDTGIALLACMMMFPIVFSFGQDPGSGPGLVFISMPLAFAEMGSGGILLGAVFFFLLTVAALTSAISLLEVAASYLIDRWNWSRPRAVISIGILIFGIGTLVAFSMSDGFFLASWTPGFGMSLFDTFDFVTSNWLLPLGGLLIAVYAGWFLPRKFRDAELASHSKATVGAWLLLVRFVAPAMVLLVLAQKIGLYDANELLYSIWN